MLTPLGKFMRKLRIDRGERIFDLAQKLAVTSSFISAIELGKKPPSDEFVERIIALYDLEGTQAEEARQAARKSRDVKIELRGASDQSRELAIAFARQFTSFDEDEISKLLGFLKKGEFDERNGH